jgi:argininosuccinate lyase
MKQMYNIKMTTVANRLEVLEVLKKNLSEHAKIVEEAREGYFKEAEAALLKRLGKGAEDAEALRSR